MASQDLDFLLVEVILDLEVRVAIVVLDHAEVELLKLTFPGFLY